MSAGRATLVQRARQRFRRLVGPGTGGPEGEAGTERVSSLAITRMLLTLLLGVLLAGALDLRWTRADQALSWVAVIDVTQSMAVTDMVSVDGEGRERRRSRLDEARSRLALALGQLPCGSRLGLGVFTAHRSILLMEPVEICENYAELLATLARIDHRMGWQGNSEIAKGLDSGLLVMRDLGSQPTLIFLTDGQEAPPISPRYRPPMHVEKGKAQALVVGVGGDELQPIPKLDALGRLAGTWAAGEVMQQDLRSLGRDANSSSQSSYVDDKPADSTPVAPVPGATPGREHLSAVREGYLRMLCQELGLDYHRLGSPEALARAMTNPAYRRDLGVAPRPLRGALAALALLLLLLVFRRELVLLASARPWRHGWDRLEGGAGRLQARAALAWRRAATRPQR